MLKISILISLTISCECVLYSSFWAPIFDRSILNYRVEATFEPGAGEVAREEYKKTYGYRGENLIANLGNGKGFKDNRKVDKVYGDVKTYYTYPGARDKPLFF